MPNPLDLNVKQDTVLSDQPAAALAPALKQFNIKTLNDLVSLGLISSKAQLEKLLQNAKTVTSTTLTRRETYTPLIRVPGTRRPDLRRYGSFVAENAGTNPMEVRSFWNVIREVEPTMLANVKSNADLSTLIRREAFQRISVIFGYLFNDITVAANTALTFGNTVKKLDCHRLLIEKGGRIVVKSSSFFISAQSIQGIQ